MRMIFQGINFNFEFAHCIIFRYGNIPCTQISEKTLWSFNLNFSIHHFKISSGLLLICGKGCPFVLQTIFFFFLNRARFPFLGSMQLVWSCDSVVASKSSEFTQMTSRPGPKYFPCVISTIFIRHAG